MLKLVYELGKSNVEMLWYATVGLSSQLVDNLISIETYTNICIDYLRNFIRKYALLNSSTMNKQNGNNRCGCDDVLKIIFEKE